VYRNAWFAKKRLDMKVWTNLKTDPGAVAAIGLPPAT